MNYYTGWLITDEDKAKLMEIFPPSYPNVIAHHVTYKFGVPENSPLPDSKKGVVIGIADDNEGIQALVVAIDDDIRRPDGSVYHITWSLDKEAGYKPVDSNDLIKIHGFEDSDPVEIDLVPFIGQ